jgi:hypothetical protein
MPTLTALQPDKLGPRSDFSVDELRGQIFKYGHRLTWEMANYCPCGRQLSTADGSFTIDTREKAVDCNTCGGAGVIYHSSQEIKAIVGDASRDPKRWALFGEHAAGGIQVTMLPEHLPGFLDRFTMLDIVMVYRERRKRKATVESARYPIVTRTLTLGSVGDPAVEAVSTIGVLHCRRAGATGEIVAGDLVQDTDFVVDANGKIDWTLGDAAGTAPSVGHYYTIQYYMRPRYVVRTFPYQYRDTFMKTKAPSVTFTNMPTKCMAWLDFITGQSSG